MTPMWDIYKVARLEELTLTEASAAQIATQLSEEFKEVISRNAVIGKANRLGLTLRHKQKGPTPRREPKTPRQREQRERKMGIHPLYAVMRRNAKLVDVKLTITEKVDPALHCEMIALTDDTCRWPMDGGLSCGAPVIAKRKSYCSIHSVASAQTLRARDPKEGHMGVRKKGRWS